MQAEAEMHIYSITDPEFALYGKVIEGLSTRELLEVLDEAAVLPAEGTKNAPAGAGAWEAGDFLSPLRSVLRGPLYGARRSG